MTRLRTVLWRLGALARPGRVAQELDDEIASHLAEATDAYEQQGLSPEDARRAALRAFGGISQTREVHRQMRTFLWLDDLVRDLRHSGRSLRRTPTFALTSAITLALAIGATTTMASVLTAVVLRPLPFRSPDELAMLWTEDPGRNLREGRSALWDVDQWRRHSATLADIATFDTVGTLLTTDQGVEGVTGASVSPNLLSLLGVQPVLGRGISLEDAEQQRPLVMISHEFWRTRLGGVQSALGTTLVINGTPAEIVGILPPDFRIGTFAPDIWQAHTMERSERGSQTWFAVARRRADTTFDQAQDELRAIAAGLNEQLPEAQRTQGVSVVPLALSIVGPETRLALWTLLGAVLCLFSIAVANVTGLAVARSISRIQEMAVRSALGAGAWRLVRQRLTEHVVIAAAAGAIGTALAYGGLVLIRAFALNLPRLNDARLDLAALGAALAVTLVAGLVVGAVTSLLELRRNLRAAVDEGGRRVSGASHVRRALVVGECALALVLLAGAALFGRSLWNINNVNMGFSPDRVLMMAIASPPTFDESQRRTDLYLRVLEQVRSLPGVESAGLIDDVFTSNPREHVLTVERADGTTTQRLTLIRDEASGEVFATMGTPLLRGRVFSIEDRPESPAVAVINETLARRSWPGQDAIGRHFKLGEFDAPGPWYTVIGVVGDMRRQEQAREPIPQIFMSVVQNSASRNVQLLVRTSSDDPATMAGALRAAVASVDRDAPVNAIVPLEVILRGFLAERRFQALLLAGFALVALLMAAVGLYGLMQYAAAMRTREIGLRMAVGARPGDIFRMMVGEGVALSATGAALGLVGAWLVGRVLSSLLFGVSAIDPWSFAAVSLLFILVALAACYVPARRAMRVDPVTVLRLQ